MSLVACMAQVDICELCQEQPQDQQQQQQQHEHFASLNSCPLFLLRAMRQLPVVGLQALHREPLSAAPVQQRSAELAIDDCFQVAPRNWRSTRMASTQVQHQATPSSTPTAATTWNRFAVAQRLANILQTFTASLSSPSAVEAIDKLQVSCGHSLLGCVC